MCSYTQYTYILRLPTILYTSLRYQQYYIQPQNTNNTTASEYQQYYSLRIPTIQPQIPQPMLDVQSHTIHVRAVTQGRQLGKETIKFCATQSMKCTKVAYGSKVTMGKAPGSTVTVHYHTNCMHGVQLLYYHTNCMHGVQLLYTIIPTACMVYSYSTIIPTAWGTDSHNEYIIVYM